MSEIARTKQRIRQFFRERPQLSRAGFCGKAKLHRNTLYGLDSESWNPTAETLDKCLETIKALEKEEAKSKPRPKSECRSVA